jgi:hypothetical protein
MKKIVLCGWKTYKMVAIQQLVNSPENIGLKNRLLLDVSIWREF